MAKRTACPYCGVGCGIAAEGERESLRVIGDAHHPANAGRLCSKGAALNETIKLDGRLLAPMIGARRASWDEAIGLVARRFQDAIRDHGPDSAAFYVSGQLLTEDYYVANKLMKGFIGSANIDTNSRLCMASAVVAQKLAFGEDVVPACYDDLDIADQIIFSGHNAAWTHPVLYRRMEAAIARGQRHIVIDPRVTDTARAAHLHLKIKSQTDVRLWNGLLAFLCEHGALDLRYIEKHTTGFEDVRAALSQSDQGIAAIAHDCGLSSADVLSFCRAFAGVPRTVTLYSQGANQSLDGVAKGLAIINAHLATGRVSTPGASPFSITGQPNAMGGRETGGMASTLAAHMDFDAADRDRVRRFWRAPRIAEKPGLKAVDMFEALAEGRIKALWIMATNPAVSMPNAGAVRAALERCPFVVVSDIIADTDTTKFAHVRLPALAWGEKDGVVTNSERCMTRQRALMAPPEEARPDWRIIADVAQAMGYEETFQYDSAADVFREYAAMTAFENDGARVLDLGPLAALNDAAYDALEPIRWPVRAGGGVDRPFATGAFPTPDGKARFNIADAQARASHKDFPLTLNTGRIRDQWHTMTRTGLSARLMRHAPEPYIDVHPRDAATCDVADGALAEVRSPFGAAVLSVHVTDAVRPGEIFAPMHWTEDFAPQARIGAVVNALVDARSGQPEFKRTPVTLAPVAIAWRAFLLTRERCDPPAGLWWRRIPQDDGMLYEIAASPRAPTASACADIFFASWNSEHVVSARDSANTFLRLAAICDDRLERAFYATTRRGLPRRDWLLAQLSASRLDPEVRRMVLAGGPAGPPRSPCVCACFDVTRAEIEALAATESGISVARVGEALKAGTNCGSCRPEIAQILQACATTKTEEPAHVMA